MMISRDVWEDAVKYERQAMLDRTRDVQYRRMVAAVIDAFSDRLYDRLDTTEKVQKMTQKINSMGGKADE